MRPEHRDTDDFFPVRSHIFPLYTVGPATARSLTTLLTSSSHPPPKSFTSLNPLVLGSDTGNGFALADYILRHYKALQDDTMFTFYEAPRLPFIPLLGGGSEQYVRRGRRRIELDDPRLKKKPLLFLAGEVRRDIIPVSLRQGRVSDDTPSQPQSDVQESSQADSYPATPKQRYRQISVDELEVYSTTVRSTFSQDFSTTLARFSKPQPSTSATTASNLTPVVIVLFSPTGSDIALEAVQNLRKTQDTIILATIGPTTRDHIRSKYGLEPEICAAKPTPESLGAGIVQYLRKEKK